MITLTGKSVFGGVSIGKIAFYKEMNSRSKDGMWMIQKAK